MLGVRRRVQHQDSSILSPTHRKTQSRHRLSGRDTKHLCTPLGAPGTGSARTATHSHTHAVSHVLTLRAHGWLRVPCHALPQLAVLRVAPAIHEGQPRTVVHVGAQLRDLEVHLPRPMGSKCNMKRNFDRGFSQTIRNPEGLQSHNNRKSLRHYHSSMCHTLAPPLSGGVERGGGT